MADLPPPRSGCLYGTIDTWNIYDGSPNSNFFLWGGHEGKDNMLYSSSVFYYSEELWKRELVVGGPPSGFKYGACTQSGDFIYCYGGLNSNSEETGELWKLNTKNISWTRLSVNTSAGPMKKMDCGMVVYGNKLFLFGGFSALSNGLNNMVGNTNELHVFDLVRGKCVNNIFLCACVSGCSSFNGSLLLGPFKCIMQRSALYTHTLYCNHGFLFIPWHYCHNQYLIQYST